MKEEYTKAEVEFKTCKELSILIAVDDEEFWIPRSLISYRSDMQVERLRRGESFTLELLTWKAQQIGL